MRYICSNLPFTQQLSTHFLSSEIIVMIAHIYVKLIKIKGVIMLSTSFELSVSYFYPPTYWERRFLLICKTLYPEFEDGDRPNTSLRLWHYCKSLEHCSSCICMVIDIIQVTCAVVCNSLAKYFFTIPLLQHITKH